MTTTTTIEGDFSHQNLILTMRSPKPIRFFHTIAKQANASHLVPLESHAYNFLHINVPSVHNLAKCELVCVCVCVWGFH